MIIWLGVPLVLNHKGRTKLVRRYFNASRVTERFFCLNLAERNHLLKRPDLDLYLYYLAWDNKQYETFALIRYHNHIEQSQAMEKYYSQKDQNFAYEVNEDLIPHLEKDEYIQSDEFNKFW